MKKLALFVFLLILFSTFIEAHSRGSKTTVHGNVMWKYNEFVGMKGDAGAKIYLLRRTTGNKASLSSINFISPDNNRVFLTSADILGKYSISVPPGNYDMLVVSKATNRNILVKINLNDDLWAKHEEYFANYIKTKDAEYLNMGTEYLLYHGLKKFILEPHVAKTEYSEFIIRVLGSNKFWVIDTFNCRAGEIVEKDVDFGNTFF